MPIVSRSELEASLSELCTHVSATVGGPREGILGPRSVAWRLGGDLAVFIGGGRASLLQLAHPMVAHAIDHHSKTRTDVVGRFQRTFRNVFAMVFGELDDALRAARRVHAIHSRIEGTFATAIGGWPAGTRYHANDVDALRWVHATLINTTIVVRELLEGPMPTGIADQYVVEMHRFARLFGIPRDRLSHTHAEHWTYMREMLASDKIVVTPSAREMGQFLFGRQPGKPQPPLGRLAEAMSASMLPRSLVEAFELRPAPRLVATALAMFRAVHRNTPAVLARIPAHADALDRLTGRLAERGPSRLAAWTERQLFGLAKSVAG
jgi:uncharacterized protein (DUF2236 family)